MRSMLIPAVFAAMLATPAHAQFHLTSMDLQDYVGQYVLADGRVLSVTQHARRLVAQVEGRPAAELRQTASATFASSDGDVVLTFDQRANGNVAGVTLTTLAEQRRQASR